MSFAGMRWLVMGWTEWALLHGIARAQEATVAEPGAVIRRLEAEAEQVAPLVKGDWTRL